MLSSAGPGGVSSSKSHKNIPPSSSTKKKKTRITNTSGLYRSSNAAPMTQHDIMALSASSPLLTDTP